MGIHGSSDRTASPPAPGPRSSTAVKLGMALAILTGFVLRLFPDWFAIPEVVFDAAEYRRDARQLLESGSYTNTFREPLMAAVLAGCQAVFGDNHLAWLRLLGFLGALPLLLVPLLVRRCLPGRSGWVTVGLLWLLATDGDQLVYCRELSTVPVHGLLLVAATVLWIESNERRSAPLGLLCGVVVGLLGLSRGSFLSLLAPMCLVSLLRPGRAGRRCAALLLGALCVVGPWLVRNQIRHGFLAPAASGGVHLFTRTWHLMPEGAGGRPVRELATVHRAAFPGVQGSQLSEDVKWKVFADLLAAGMPPAEIDRCFLDVSKENILARPGPYLRESAAMLARALGTYDFTWLDEDYANAMRKPLAGQLGDRDWAFAFLKLVFRVVLPILALLALVAGMATTVVRRIAPPGILLGSTLWLVTLVTLAGPSPGVRRYRSELDALLLTAFAVGAVHVWSWRSSSRRPSSG